MPSVPFEISGYSPDSRPDAPGILLDAVSIIPSSRGIAAAPSAEATSLPALAAKCLGAYLSVDLTGTARLYAGTQTALFEASTSTWTDRTRAVGGAYTGGAESLWRFTQFGNVALATNKTDNVQQATGAAFSNLTAAPKAAIITTIGSFVFVCDTNEATFGDSPDRWWCSAIGDFTNWTPSLATQCATNRLTSFTGKITAAKPLGERIIIHKRRGFYSGVYTGPSDFVWAFHEAPVEFGAVCQEVVVDIGSVHIFMSDRGFHMYDGAQITNIDDDVREFFLGRVDEKNMHLSKSVHNKELGLIYFYYPPSGGTTGVPSECLVYNYRSGRWGRDDSAVEAGVEFVQAGTTYDGFGSLYATYNDIAAIAYDSSFWSAGTPVPAVFDTAHVIKTLTGMPGNWSYQTGDYGDESAVTLLKRLIPRFSVKPGSALLTNRYRMQLGDAPVNDSSAPLTAQSRFDVLRAARYHSYTMSGAGEMEQTGFAADLRSAGYE